MKKKVKLSPEALKREIEMQTQALNKIRTWINLSLIVSSIGILLIYLGVNAQPFKLYFLIPGIIIAVIGVVVCVIFGLGHHNGKLNVEKMINVLEKEIHEDSKK